MITSFTFELTFGKDTEVETTLTTTGSTIGTLTASGLPGIVVTGLDAMTADDPRFAVWLSPAVAYTEAPSTWSYTYTIQKP